jgi:hypothetical protein
VKWAHLYLFKDRKFVEWIIQRIETTRAFDAIVVTCDHAHDGVRTHTMPYFENLEPFLAERFKKISFPNIEA